MAGYVPGIGIIKENIITNRYVFDASMIETLIAKYANSEGFENQKQPSRVKALYSVHHAVNLRPRTNPPQPQSSFGNLFSVAITIPILKNGEEGHGLVHQVREGISKIDKDYVKKLQEGSQHFIRDHSSKFAKGEMVTFSFTSLCRFPPYETDFGWGKPIWVGPAALTYKNLITFIDTPSSDGIEAYVSLKKEEMDKFESDEEFLTFVSLPGIQLKN